MYSANPTVTIKWSIKLRVPSASVNVYSTVETSIDKKVANTHHQKNCFNAIL